MRLILTSAGITNDSLKKVFKKFAGEHPKIAFIPTAANIEEGDKTWFIDELNDCKQLGEIDIVDISALDKKIWLSRLKKAEVIFVGGGNTTYLVESIKKSGLDKELAKLLETKIYVGISAGSMVLSKTIQASSEYLFKLYEDETKNPPLGLGYIEFDIRPHMNSPYFPKVTKENLNKVFAKTDSDIYVLDDNSAVIFENGKIEVVSEGDWIKYPKN